MVQKSSTSQMVVGVLGVVIGLLGLISGILILIALFAGPIAALLGIGTTSFTLFGSISYVWAIVLGALARSQAVLVCMLIVVMIIPLLAMIGGIGLIRRARWARAMLLVYSILKLCVDVISIVILLIIVAAAQYEASKQGWYSFSGYMAGGIAIAVILVALSLIYPLVSIVVLATAKPTVPPSIGAKTMVNPTFGRQNGAARPTIVAPSAGSGPLKPTAGGPVQSKATQQLVPLGLAKRSASLIVVSGRDLHREYTIALEDFQGQPVRNTIGRDPSCQVVVSGDPSVGSRHCEIRMEDGHLCLFNLASSNPTIVCRGTSNKFEVTGKEFLRDGDRIWVGSTELQLHVSEFQQDDLGR